jgi:hypothetical protein
MFKQVLAVTMLAASFAVTGANAASNNPLDPSFERNIGVSFAPVTGSAIDTGATRNPLNPAFYQARVNVESKGDATWFDATANNPLHPSYNRS